MGGRKKYAFVDTTVFQNGCKILLHRKDGMMAAEMKVKREVGTIVDMVVNEVPLVILKSFPNDPFAKELIEALSANGIEIQKL